MIRFACNHVDESYDAEAIQKQKDAHEAMNHAYEHFKAARDQQDRWIHKRQQIQAMLEECDDELSLHQQTTVKRLAKFRQTERAYDVTCNMEQPDAHYA